MNKDIYRLGKWIFALIQDKYLSEVISGEGTWKYLSSSVVHRVEWIFESVGHHNGHIQFVPCSQSSICVILSLLLLKWI